MSSHLPTISLTQNEAQLAQLLVDCATWVDANPHEVDELRLKDGNGRWIGKQRGTEKVELRIAGGWVRDKLLGQQSDDIDVSIHPDPITGLKFATLFEKYLNITGQPHLVRAPALPSRNREPTKLTSRFRTDRWESLLKLKQSRINRNIWKPLLQMFSFGTPLEDAQRRDLTINALFYNLHSSSVEDQTGLGLQDLGLVPGYEPRIRTPMEPFETFQDDPLRVVRAVRFAARFGRRFELDAGLEQAIGREEIREALRDPKKISRERVGIELEKMLLGHDPLYAMELIERLHLHSLIFLSTVSASPTPEYPVPPPIQPAQLSVEASKILADLLSLPSPSPSTLRPLLHPALTLSVSSSPSSPTPSSTSSPTTTLLSRSITRRLFTSAGLLPIYEQWTLEKGKPAWLGGHVIMDGIKGAVVDRKWVENARKASKTLSEGVRRFGVVVREAMQEGEERGEIGMLLKDLTVHDQLQDGSWNVSLLWSLVVDLVQVQGDQERSRALIDSYNRFTSLVISHHLDTDAFAPCLLDGTEILATLPRAKGPAMTDMKELVFRFQFSHPGCSKDDGRAYLLGEEGQRKLDEAVERASRPRPPQFGQPLKKKKGKGGVVAGA
ncbi:hypothetical protein P7C70_g278, partial [Phenoliferia sp. Uapishka_3]